MHKDLIAGPYRTQKWFQLDLDIYNLLSDMIKYMAIRARNYSNRTLAIGKPADDAGYSFRQRCIVYRTGSTRLWAGYSCIHIATWAAHC